MNSAEHRTVRELLGAFVLGHLRDAEEVRVRAHLDGCVDCRRELAELQPIVRALSTVDAQHVSGAAAPQPDPELGRRIHDAVAGERRGRDRRRRRRQVVLAAAVTGGVLLVGGVGVVVGRTFAEPPSTTATVPVEPVAVTSRLDGAEASAGVVAHTWGVEIKLEAVGLRSGASYSVLVRTVDGQRSPAGAFVGTGQQVMNCNLNTDVLRPDASGFAVLDQTGRTVLTADL